MNSHLIKNWNDVARGKQREDVLAIVEAGLKAINTEKAIQDNLLFENNILSIGGVDFVLDNFERVVVFGIGKASRDAVSTIEGILGNKISIGIAIDKSSHKGKYVEIFKGSHPYPSKENVLISEKIVTTAESLTEKDLAIVIVSGGGSALLCYPEKECEQETKLYKEFLKSGHNIRDLNLIRKHLSDVKGGGLAKSLYPAQVVSLILCDVSGDYYEDVASGPTYKDNSTVKDAQDMLDKLNIKEKFDLNETPKEDKYFQKVMNIPIVSNGIALNAMKEYSESLGYKTVIAGKEFQDSPKRIFNHLVNTLGSNDVVLGGGEATLQVPADAGFGGRNEHTAMSAIKLFHDNMTFASIASDGIDNETIHAGAIVDTETKKIIDEKGLDLDATLKKFDAESLLNQTNDLIEIGETGANIADLYVLMKK